MAKTKSVKSKWPKPSPHKRKTASTHDRIVNSEVDPVHCESCQTEPMELVSVEPYFFVGISRLLYQCRSCAKSSGAILIPDPNAAAAHG